MPMGRWPSSRKTGARLEDRIEGEYPMKQHRWNALHVRPHFEFVVATYLRERGIEHFLPLQKKGRTKSVESPLFPGYIFSKCDPETKISLMYIPGVLGALSSGKSQVYISERQIENLRQIVHAGCRLLPWPFALGDRKVRVESGALRGVVGTLEGMADKRLLVLSIHLMQRAIAVDLGSDCVLSFAAANTFPWHSA
jgi:transcription termination/antitermination protein NusG